MQKRDKKSRMKKRRKEKGRNRIKKRKAPTTFSKKMKYFQKSKDVKKRGDTRIEHKKDVKHNSKLEKHFTKYHSWRKEINKGFVKNMETFQNEGFFDVSRRLAKAQNWRCERGQQISHPKKREHKKNWLQEKKSKRKNKKHKEN